MTSLLPAVGALALAISATDDAGTRAFVEQARAATLKYRDRAAAIADGYRLIGEDFPGMGEHWINIGLVFDRRYDVAHPEFLAYADVGGRPRLLGVAYALPLLAGEEPPEAPAGRAAWHAHSRGVDDETLVPRHHAADHEGGGPRLAMLHAWIWLDNPEGLFAPDNWAIPFARLGLTPPRTGGVDAGKALALLSGADGYLERAVLAAAAPDPVDGAALRAAIAGAREAARSIVAAAGPELSEAELAALAGAWDGMWRAISGRLPAGANERLRALALR